MYALTQKILLPAASPPPRRRRGYPGNLNAGGADAGAGGGAYVLPKTSVPLSCGKPSFCSSRPSSFLNRPMFSRALNSSLSGSGPAPGCPSNLPCLATDDFCYKYDCAVARICSTAACKCSGDAACAGSLSGTTSTPYCLSGTCSSLSPGVIAGITIAVLVVVVAVVICIVRRRQK